LANLIKIIKINCVFEAKKSLGLKWLLLRGPSRNLGISSDSEVFTFNWSFSLNILNCFIVF